MTQHGQDQAGQGVGFDTMNPEEQNIAIAQSLGFYVHREGRIDYISHDPKPNWDHRVYQSNPMPRYCADLNLMHEAEGKLDAHDGDAYVTILESMLFGQTSPVFATAAQRAEAYLRTISKWEDQQ